MSSYIVRFKEGTTDDAFQKAKDEITSAGGSIGHEYTLFKGFVATLPEVSAANLKNHPDVDGIEKDSVVTTQ
ncbi:similar to Saccharomyces cerevisiae YNL015W PBI2 Cytosolic inhibitor of vacuolar proteinase B (PRB1),required for efficient vacuole inheritance [Geotrichum candidum]|uniref:Similar to Saccharomyces cerevisiae YNL015W PBI2 Cytosolic inhibitor of vacuolar proteinase B (PRB1),required for efficient vacuole inheritance n=1 Tax=Geotrichum candidum TaxID=1173061 RepID=A0A0J9XDS5_GEOCN|nr:similar to Saccharomyces cerevisiae YNL015W PBI2 Cytosolic inhibitor of vacuolar proteinase B (PRB1),required for efficient vacuole inheritance [Geotrichum candidum]